MTCWEDPIGGHAPFGREKRGKSARSRGVQVCIQVRLGARRKKQTARAKTVQYSLGVGVSKTTSGEAEEACDPDFDPFH